MYLLVFSTLVIALIGLYAQVITAQTARFAGQQTAIAQQMLLWHTVAVSQAKNTGITAIATGCSLTLGVTTPALCTGSTGASVYVSTFMPTTANSWGGSPYFGTTCSGSPITPPCWTNLPGGYQTNTYSFNSVYFKATNNINYVITYVVPPIINAANPAPGFVVTANGSMLGLTMADLYSQFQKAGFPVISYGTVTTGGANPVLTTPAISNGLATGSPQYNIPPSINTVGTLAIISSP
jgi:hypothetical protein